MEEIRTWILEKDEAEAFTRASQAAAILEQETEIRKLQLSVLRSHLESLEKAMLEKYGIEFDRTKDRLHMQGRILELVSIQSE